MTCSRRLSVWLAERESREARCSAQRCASTLLDTLRTKSPVRSTRCATGSPLTAIRLFEMRHVEFWRRRSGDFAGRGVVGGPRDAERISARPSQAKDRSAAIGNRRCSWSLNTANACCATPRRGPQNKQATGREVTVRARLLVLPVFCDSLLNPKIEQRLRGDAVRSSHCSNLLHERSIKRKVDAG